MKRGPGRLAAHTCSLPQSPSGTLAQPITQVSGCVCKCRSGNQGDGPCCFLRLKMETALCHTWHKQGCWGNACAHNRNPTHPTDTSRPPPGTILPCRLPHTSACTALRLVRGRDRESFCFIFVKGVPTLGRRQPEGTGLLLAVALTTPGSRGAKAFSVDPGSWQSQEVEQLTPNSLQPHNLGWHQHTQMRSRESQIDPHANSTTLLDRAWNGRLLASPK